MVNGARSVVSVSAFAAVAGAGVDGGHLFVCLFYIIKRKTNPFTPRV